MACVAEVRPHFINARCFGEDFAAWLHQALSRRGLQVSEPMQEDWGWCLFAVAGGAKFTVSVGIMDDSIGQVPAEGRVGVAYERPMNGFLALFKPVPMALLESLGAQLRDALAGDPSISDLRVAA